MFHMDQEGLHALFHRINPTNLTQLDLSDPLQFHLVRAGLVVSEPNALDLFAEGLRGGGLISRIPGLGKLQDIYSEWLFKDYIPRMKMTMAMHAYERNVKRFPTLSQDVIAEMTANQGNAAFGELNYRMMGRSPTMQDLFRLTFLAPDFLEARSRFVAQALGRYGKEQRVALILGAATLYATARVLNQWLDGDAHWDKPFSVIYNGQEYRLRTVMGDAAEAFMDPRRFFMNRLSPWTRALFTLSTGRDYRGIKLTAWEQIKDMLSWFVPIPVGGSPNEPQTIPQRIVGSFGVANKPAETPVALTYQAANKWREKQTDPKIQAEVRRAFQSTQAESDYAALNKALVANDKERAANEIQKLMKERGKTGVDLAKYYVHFPIRPFTGSATLDARWQQQDPRARLLIRKANIQRQNMSRLFFQLLPMAQHQAR
jgi:hypothetical protein